MHGRALSCGLHAPMDRFKGELFGDLAIFMSGQRTATCVVAEPGTIIAVMPFFRIVELEMQAPQVVIV